MRFRGLLSAHHRLYPKGTSTLTNSARTRLLSTSSLQISRSTHISSFPASVHRGPVNHAWPGTALLAPVLLTAAGTAALCEAVQAPDASDVSPEAVELINWSGTQCVSTTRYFQPESLEELKRIVQQAHLEGRKLRPIGSALRPERIGFPGGGYGQSRADGRCAAR